MNDFENPFIATWMGSAGTIAGFAEGISKGKFRRKLLVAAIAVVGGLVPALYCHPTAFSFVLSYTGFSPDLSTDVEARSELTTLSVVVPCFCFGLAGLACFCLSMSIFRADCKTQRSLDARLLTDVEVDPDEWVLAENIPFRKSKRRKRLKTGCDRGF